MTRADKAVRVQTVLDELHPETPVPLDHADPYTLLVAVLLSKELSCTVRAPVESARTAPPLPPAAVLLSNELPLLMVIKPEVREA